MSDKQHPKFGYTDSEIIAHLATRASRHAARAEQHFRDLQPVLDDLAAVGFPCPSGDKIAEMCRPLQKPAIEVLLSWIPRVTNRNVKAVLIDALAFSEISFDGTPLVEAFEADNLEGLLRWPISATMASADVVGINDWLSKAVQNRIYGTARQNLVMALAKNVPPEISLPILRSVLDELPGWVAEALRKMKIGAVEELEALKVRLPAVSKPWVRKEFELAIKAIERRLAKPPKPRRKRQSHD